MTKNGSLFLVGTQIAVVVLAVRHHVRAVAVPALFAFHGLTEEVGRYAKYVVDLFFCRNRIIIFQNVALLILVTINLDFESVLF